MKQLFYSTLAILMCTSALAAERYYVSPRGQAGASGHSWSAATLLSNALQLAEPGDEIWALHGEYRLQSRGQSFVVPAGVKFYGGFAGHEATPDDRQANGAYRTVLSGELGDPASLKDNAYTVVRLQSAGHHVTVIDGFEVTRGSARTFQAGFDPTTTGGGMVVEAGAGGHYGNHHVSNCTFSHNTAHNGGAVYLSGGQIRFTDCEFRSNTADYNGGAVYNDGRQHPVNPIFQNCRFVDNGANSGGAMTNNGENGEAVALVRTSQFEDNVVKMNGSVAYNKGNRSGTATMIAEACFYRNNETPLGEMIAGDGVTETIARKQQRLGGGTLTPAKRK